MARLLLFAVASQSAMSYLWMGWDAAQRGETQRRGVRHKDEKVTISISDHPSFPYRPSVAFLSSAPVANLSAFTSSSSPSCPPSRRGRRKRQDLRFGAFSLTLKFASLNKLYMYCRFLRLHEVAFRAISTKLF